MTLSIGLRIQNDLISTGETVVHVATNVFTTEKVSLGIKVANVVRYIGCASNKLLNNTKSLPTVGVLKLMNLGTVPLAIYEIGRSVFSAAKASLNEKVDAVLGIISTIGTLGDIASTTAQGLAAVGAVASKAIAWATPLAIASAAVEGVGLFLTIKSLIETHRFSKALKQTAALEKPVEEYSVEDFTKGRLLIIDKQNIEKSFTGKHLKTDSTKLNERLLQIESKAQEMIDSDNPQRVREGKQKLQTMMQSLSQRMTSKKWSNALTILSGIVGLVGLGVLFSPCPPAGFILLAISGVLSMVNFFYEKTRTARLEKSLGI